MTASEADVLALANVLQIFQDVNEFQIPPGQYVPTQSNLNRARYLIEQGWTHASWMEAA